MKSFILFFRALFDPRTPITAKLLIGAAALYGISPIDFIPDFIPFIGEADDLTIIIIAILIFLRMTKNIRHERTDVIDAHIVP